MLSSIRNLAVVCLIFAFSSSPAEAMICGHAGSSNQPGICGGGGHSFCSEGGCYSWTCDDIELGIGVVC
jgi:hypothetical protein